MRIRLNLSYDGTDFLGWQIQREGRTVQGELETALQSLFNTASIRSYAAGRTDAGVHAVMQVVHFNTTVKRDAPVIVKALNALLPKDVHVWRARVVDNEFHARFAARARVYAYRILNQPDIFIRHLGWPVDKSFDPASASEISRLFLGQHDFRAFSTQPDPEESTVCEVRKIRWRADEHGWVMEIEADRFIRRMVRSVVGSIVACASGKVESEVLAVALKNGSGRVPPPAPPQGLALVQVRYDSDDQLDRPPASLWGDFPQPH